MERGGKGELRMRKGGAGAVIWSGGGRTARRGVIPPNIYEKPTIIYIFVDPFEG